jgi:hypothetical protein
MNAWTRFAATAALGASLVATAVAAPAAPAAEPAAVVTAFCAAVSERKLDRVTALFAPGSVQFSLRPSHTGVGDQPSGSLTSDLKAHWSMIGPVLFTATKSYSRKAEILDTRVDGDIATVWTRTTTVTERADNAGKKTDEFVEVYLLVRKDGQWKIGAVADNRRPNDVGLGKP